MEANTSFDIPTANLLDAPDVLFIPDLASLFRVSRTTIERRRRNRSFPIPELPALDKRPRFAKRAVEEFLASTSGSPRMQFGTRRSGTSSRRGGR